jgi:integrase
LASFKQRNQRWVAQVKIAGRFKSATFNIKQEAQIWAAQQELAAIRGDSHGLETSNACFADVLKKYKAIITATKRGAENEAIIINRLLREAWVDIAVSSLSLELLSCFRDQRLSSVKSSTFKHEWAIVKAAANAAESLGFHVPVKLFKSLILPKIFYREIERLLPSDEQKLLKEAQKISGQNIYILPLIKLALATGMRRGEILSIHWKNINFNDIFIEVKAINTKSGYGRYIPLNSDIALILEDLRLLAPPNERVFPISTNSLRTSFEKLRRLAGMPQLRFHDLRHESISRFHEMGLTLPEIQSISGHRELSMLQRYSHANQMHLRKKLAGGVI